MLRFGRIAYVCGSSDDRRCWRRENFRRCQSHFLYYFLIKLHKKCLRYARNVGCSSTGDMQDVHLKTFTKCSHKNIRSSRFERYNPVLCLKIFQNIFTCLIQLKKDAMFPAETSWSTVLKKPLLSAVLIIVKVYSTLPVSVRRDDFN